MIGCKVAKKAIVMDRLQRKDGEGQIKGAAKIDTIRSLRKMKKAKSVALTKTYQDIVLNLSLFFALNAQWCSVRDFPHCPSWEARPQLEPLLHPTLNSQNC